jgi:outer membrane protein insertion porin family
MLRRSILLCLALWAPLSQAAPAKAIEKIQVEGRRRIEEDAILEKMSLKPGMQATPEKVRADIKNIFSLGYFEDIRFEQDGGTLKVKVRERPVVVEIKYEGSEEFEPKDLEEATGLKPFNVLNLDKIHQAQAAIAKKYEEKGYYLARAIPEMQPVNGRPEEIKLIFRVEENDKVIVRRIFFLGNQVFSAGDLKKIMTTSEGHVFSWASGGGTYREAAFERDLAGLAFFYGNEGYIEAKFGKPRVTLSQDRRYVDIFIDVTEGQKFFLGSTEFKGDLLFPTEELQSSFEMKKGDVFSTGKLQEQILKLTDKYGDQGYAFANVIPRTRVRAGKQIVDLTIDIEKGEKVYWGKINVTGNTKTHDKVIRRELLFFEGELYNATKRKKSLDRVKRLGFFGNDVNFLTSTPEGTTNILDVEIKVSEKPSGTLMVQAGYGNAIGFTFGAQITQNNLFGLGQQLSFQTNITQGHSKTFNLSFTDPKVFDSEYLLGTDLYIQENDIGGRFTSYSQRLLGGDVRVGREIFEDLNAYLMYKYEKYKLKDPINPDIYTNPEKDPASLISSMTATLTYDKRNNRLDPTGGYYLSASSEFAGLGGRTFQKYSLQTRYYHRLFGDLTFRSRVEYGLLTNAFNDDTVPDTERYVLGGIFSLRGYPASSVGPSKTLVNTRDLDNNGNPRYKTPFPFTVGGTQKLLTNQELEFPLIPDADIRIAFFFDAGNAWDSFSATSPALLGDYGWGIRWYSPLGPLRFEWGYPLTTNETKRDLGAEFHFIIAPTF